MTNGLQEISEQLVDNRLRQSGIMREVVERAMHLRDQAWRSFQRVILDGTTDRVLLASPPTEEQLNARTAELLKAEPKK